VSILAFTSSLSLLDFDFSLAGTTEVVPFPVEETRWFLLSRTIVAARAESRFLLARFARVSE
jgi:hypothetical protein